MTSANKPDNAAEAQPTVFLSYSRDDRHRALPVIAALEAAGIKVWWDGLLTGGDTFIQTTEQMLETADAVVVLWTQTSVNSHWVRDEATRGRERRCLVPVILDATPPPLGFRQIHYVDLSGWAGKASAPEMAELVRAIRQVIAAGTREIDPAAAIGAIRMNGTPRTSRRALLIGGGGVLAAGAAFAGWRSGLFGSGAQVNSIAVMPFRNLSADPGQSYLSDGLAEELRAMISLNRQIEVAAQSSTVSVRDADLSVPAIAAKLGVAFVLEGSVQVARDSLRVVVRLVDGGDGFQKWSQVFDRKLTDVLVVQSEIAAMVTDSLVTTILADTRKAAERIGGTRDAAAFDAYLRGAALFALAESETTDRQSLAAFEEAIRIDPRYALAHAARANTLMVIRGSYASGSDVLKLNEAAQVAARRAIALAPDLPKGQAVLGFNLYSCQLDLAAAREPMERALELGFGDAGILNGYASFASYVMEFDKARTALARAKRLDPLNAGVWRGAASVEFQARNFAAAEAEARMALTKNGKINVANRILGDIALLRGDIAAAEAFYAAEPSTLSRLRGLAIAAHRRGDTSLAQSRLAELIAEFGTNSLYQQAQIFAQWGEPAKALDALEGCFAVRDAGLLFTSGDALLDPIRKDRRFAAVLARLGFDPAGV